MGRAIPNPPTGILIVEDDSTFLSFWRRFFDDLGIHDYKLVSNPYEAKDIILRGGCRLLISDINMHGMSGYELAKICCEQSPETSIILTTAYEAHLSHFDLEDCKFHLLYKPYNNLEELAKMIRHILAGDASFDDLSEDSYSENDEYPLVTEWKL
jgi:DNA-binding NtrC family response regulator